MQVQVSRMHLLNGNGPAKAVCTLVLGEAFAIHGVRIIEGRHGLFVQMPQEKGRDGQWRDICHPVTSELRQTIQTVALRAYTEMVSASNKDGAKKADG